MQVFYHRTAHKGLIKHFQFLGELATFSQQSSHPKNISSNLFGDQSCNYDNAILVSTTHLSLMARVQAQKLDASATRRNNGATDSDSRTVYMFPNSLSSYFKRPTPSLSAAFALSRPTIASQDGPSLLQQSQHPYAPSMPSTKLGS